MKISFIVVAYNMQREILRTLRSLSRDYQINGDELDYEVIVIDNASPTPLDLGDDLGDDHENDLSRVPVTLIRRDQASVSPADAINLGVRESSGDVVAIMIDGARMLSPGVIDGICKASALAADPVIAVLGLHLGPSHQRESVKRGYSKQVEDQLLESIGWPADGYRLFEISSWGGSSPGGWFGDASESNCIALPRVLFDQLGGYDEHFEMPGGGLVNLDFYKRAVEADSTELVYLLGEGCFHQLHGGVTTGGQDNSFTFTELDQEYHAIRGESFSRPQVPPTLFGKLGPQHAPAIAMASKHLMKDKEDVDAVCRPFLDS